MSFATEPVHTHGAPPAASSTTAILLCNLGTPDEPTAPALRRYLAEFLSDARVVEIPRLLWWLMGAFALGNLASALAPSLGVAAVTFLTTGLFAGIPVSVAAATCYTMDLSAPARELTGVAGGTSFNLVQVYDDDIVHSVVPIGSFDVATRFPESFLDRMEALSADERLDAFSRQV